MTGPAQALNLSEIGLVLVGLLFVGLVVALSLYGVRKRMRADVERIAAVERCFTELARKRGLELERRPALQHPVMGEIRVAPRVVGQLDGFALELAVEGEPALDGDELTILRLHARAGAPDWPIVADPCRRAEQLPASLREPLARLCASSNQVVLEARTLIVAPKVAAKTDWSGNTRRIETDPERLDALLELASTLARALSS